MTEEEKEKAFREYIDQAASNEAELFARIEALAKENKQMLRNLRFSEGSLQTTREHNEVLKNEIYECKSSFTNCMEKIKEMEQNLLAEVKRLLAENIELHLDLELQRDINARLKRRIVDMETK